MGSIRARMDGRPYDTSTVAQLKTRPLLWYGPICEDTSTYVLQVFRSVGPSVLRWIWVVNAISMQTGFDQILRLL